MKIGKGRINIKKGNKARLESGNQGKKNGQRRIKIKRIKKMKVKRQYQPNKVANGEGKLEETEKKDNKGDKRLGWGGEYEVTRRERQHRASWERGGGGDEFIENMQ